VSLLGEFSYGGRLLLALGFLASVSGIELAVRGRSATRWRSSIALIVCGAAGAAVGVAVDLLTSSIGPAYFAVGKGLGAGPGLGARALRLGAQAGVAAGVVAGALLLLMARRPLGLLEVGRAFARILAHLGPGLGIGLAIGALVPADLVAAAGFAEVEAADRRGFALAFGAHLGAYGGALLGTLREGRRLAAAARRAGAAARSAHDHLDL
jgi:hypothetical protein